MFLKNRNVSIKNRSKFQDNHSNAAVSDVTQTKKMYIKTYGCQMNVYDSDKIQDIMHHKGYHVTNQMDEADLIVLNTCHIREKAAEKVYSELGRIKALRSNNKNLLIAVAGCVSQAEGGEIFKRAPFVNMVVGPQSYYNLPKMIEEFENNKEVDSKKRKKNLKLIQLDFVEEEKFDKLPEEVKPISEVSRFVSVQEGCDKFCAFCVVPYTRGAEFSRPVEHIYREALSMANRGAKEIILLGQNVNAYHGMLNVNTDNDDNISSNQHSNQEVNLAYLIRKIAKIPDIKRIRYTTSHPIDMDDDLIKLHGEEEKLMPFLHLPVQSGSNTVLKLMNRKYTRERYIEIIAQLRRNRPDIVLSSDFIVGFPGETDKDFEDTLSLVKEIRYGQCYSFKYSMRPGTPAVNKDQVPENIKQERLIILQKELLSQQIDLNQKSVGKVMPVLFDRDGRYDNQIVGKTPYMQSVHVNNINNTLNGQIVNVRISAAWTNSLGGFVV